MIIGIGSDIISISRIARLLGSRKEQFLQRILTPNEITMLQHSRLEGYVANRFAAKEAFSKAFGTGIGKHVSFQDLEILKTPQGQPYFKLSNKVKDFLQKKYGNNIKIHLSMSNETEYAHATVIIESY